MYTLPSADAAKRFVALFPSVIIGKTGRHTYTEWDQVLMGAGAAHPAMNPFNMPANAECRKTYSKDMCAKSLEILDRTVMVATDPGTQPRTSPTPSTISASRPAWRSAARRSRKPIFAMPSPLTRRSST